MATQFKMRHLAVLVSGLFVTGYAIADDSNGYAGTVSIQGQDQGGTNSGLIQQEDSPKSRSSVTKAEIEKKSQTNNPFQMLSLAPGVNTYDYDGTGLFGGGMRVRGFNSDELGFTVDGVPVNDSGSFAVYPSEYADSNNLCNIFVTQGSTDIDAPHIGASGGNIGINTCDPEDKHRLRIKQTIGSNSLTSTFVRIDTGRFLDDSTKAFVSYSHTEADKWKGDGDAKKDHVDFKINGDLGGGSTLSAGLLYNQMLNNNYLMPTKAQIAQYGYNVDLGVVPPVHQPINGTATLNDKTYAPNVNANIPALGYYGLSLNPFENYIATLKGHFAFSSKVSLDIDPYLWYGYGTGGNELQTLTEGTGSTKLYGGIGDLNGNGNTKDTIYYYNGSLTRTWRPGFTTKFNFQLLDNNLLQVGYWAERARQAQTGPYIPIDSNGNSVNIWETSDYATYANGTPIQYRDWNTVSTSSKIFLQDNISLFKDKLNIQLGIAHAETERNFTNNPSNYNSGSLGYYNYVADFSKTLPSLGVTYHVTPEHQVFFNAAENFKVPGNYTYSGLLSGGSIVNGVYTGKNIVINQPSVVPETSNNFDLGYRYQGKKLTFSGSLYYVDFKNRIASAWDPVRQIKTDYNVGDSKTYGAEFESGYQFLDHWTAYTSLTYMKNNSTRDIPLSATQILPTKGKALPDDPNWLAGFSLEYARDQWYVMGQAKYTGHRYTTLVNDDALGGYTTFSLDAGYTFPSFQFIKKPTLSFNAYNLFNKQFLNLNTSSGSSFTTNAQPVQTAGGVVAANSPSFVVGAPRTFAVTLKADF